MRNHISSRPLLYQKVSRLIMSPALLGIDQFLSFTVASPFDYEENMTIKMPAFSEKEGESKFDYILEKLSEHKGRDSCFI